MRLILNLSRNKVIVPFNYQEVQVSKLHYWLGKNDIHDSLSLYSFSWLKGGKAIDNRGLDFRQGAQYFISCFDVDLIKQIIKSIQQDNHFEYGMGITSLSLQKEPQFMEENRFQVGSPVFIKRTVEGNSKFYYPSDDKANLLLTETLINKLKKANINHKGVKVSFDENYQNILVKGTTYKGIQNKGTICPIIIQGTPEQLAFAWNVGVGNSTGIGFGSLI
ncbi:CRISPR-associated endoribonuclease Cas6 [Emticicia agri]|uniref:CRISPR-associated endoribonuclease Cas6 n=1 Tax=Emticicia agri TaxID=2492393 RepID=A0A4Q5LTG4_9BACT|nr:CRISPR-associated endoribonuclease Cas6 [Emticicia agri]RYU92864.1 CRISPR-associated endoribonuclease Cas6 [Emticicia agri]